MMSTQPGARYEEQEYLAKLTAEEVRSQVICGDEEAAKQCLLYY